jgi:hypothetical protein
MTTHFTDLLDYTSDDVSKPRGCPEAWLTADLGPFIRDKSRSGTEFIRFDLLNVQPHEDNPPDVMESLKDIDFSKLRSPFCPNLTVDYWLTEDALYHLSGMLDRVIGHPNASLRSRLEETRGVRVMFKVKPRVRENGEQTGETQVDGRSLGPVTYINP